MILGQNRLSSVRSVLYTMSRTKPAVRLVEKRTLDVSIPFQLHHPPPQRVHDAFAEHPKNKRSRAEVCHPDWMESAALQKHACPIQR